MYFQELDHGSGAELLMYLLCFCEKIVVTDPDPFTGIPSTIWEYVVS